MTLARVVLSVGGGPLPAATGCGERQGEPEAVAGGGPPARKCDMLRSAADMGVPYVRGYRARRSNETVVGGPLLLHQLAGMLVMNIHYEYNIPAHTRQQRRTRFSQRTFVKEMPQEATRRLTISVHPTVRTSLAQTARRERRSVSALLASDLARYAQGEDVGLAPRLPQAGGVASVGTYLPSEVAKRVRQRLRHDGTSLASVAAAIAAAHDPLLAADERELQGSLNAGGLGELAGDTAARDLLAAYLRTAEDRAATLARLRGGLAAVQARTPAGKALEGVLRDYAGRQDLAPAARAVADYLAEIPPETIDAVAAALIERFVRQPAVLVDRSMPTEDEVDVLGILFCLRAAAAHPGASAKLTATVVGASEIRMFADACAKLLWSLGVARRARAAEDWFTQMPGTLIADARAALALETTLMEQMLRQLCDLAGLHERQGDR
jgi:hypothetical protein